MVALMSAILWVDVGLAVHLGADTSEHAASFVRPPRRFGCLL